MVDRKNNYIFKFMNSTDEKIFLEYEKIVQMARKNPELNVSSIIEAVKLSASYINLEGWTSFDGKSFVAFLGLGHDEARLRMLSKKKPQVWFCTMTLNSIQLFTTLTKDKIDLTNANVEVLADGDHDIRTKYRFAVKYKEKKKEHTQVLACENDNCRKKWMFIIGMTKLQNTKTENVEDEAKGGVTMNSFERIDSEFALVDELKTQRKSSENEEEEAFSQHNISTIIENTKRLDFEDWEYEKQEIAQNIRFISNIDTDYENRKNLKKGQSCPVETNEISPLERINSNLTFEKGKRQRLSGEDEKGIIVKERLFNFLEECIYNLWSMNDIKPEDMRDAWKHFLFYYIKNIQVCFLDSKRLNKTNSLFNESTFESDDYYGNSIKHI